MKTHFRSEMIVFFVLQQFMYSSQFNTQVRIVLLTKEEGKKISLNSSRINLYYRSNMSTSTFRRLAFRDLFFFFLFVFCLGCTGSASTTFSASRLMGAAGGVVVVEFPPLVDDNDGA